MIDSRRHSRIIDSFLLVLLLIGAESFAFRKFAWGLSGRLLLRLPSLVPHASRLQF